MRTMSLASSLFRAPTALVLSVLVASGCGGSRIDKAGGSRPAKPLVLTLAAYSGDEGYAQPFAAAVERLSGRALQIKILGNWPPNATPHDEQFAEGRLVSDVRVGKAQLGLVAARAWDTLGVRSFQALVAPFLIDSLALERQAVESPPADQALASIRRTGVIGVALLPGPLRRPFGITRPLIRPADYRGARIGIRPSLVADQTFRALGARASVYTPGDLSGLDGAELDSLTITENIYDRHARALTANVVLWPKVWTIIINEAVFGRLNRSQREILLAAGRDAVAAELAQTARDQQAGLSNLCREKFPLPAATAAELTALRTAVQPVYAQIERNALTKQWVAQIQRMQTATTPDIARCRRP
jgi:TRAP-type C4-dicarboxylate transport system substrate-binding protein